MRLAGSPVLLMFLAATSAAGCLAPDYGPRPFACGAGGLCPSGYSCQAGVCVNGQASDVGGADALSDGLAPDAAGDGQSPDDADAAPDAAPDGPADGKADLADGPADLADGQVDLAEDFGPADSSPDLTYRTLVLRQGAPLPAGGTYQGVRDTWLDLIEADTPNGSQMLLYIDTPADTKHSLIRFDLAPLPAGVLILSATLRLRVDGGTAGTHTIGAFLIKRPWSDDATWNGPTGTGSSWDVAGGLGSGDAESTPTATALRPLNGDDLELDLTAAVKAWAAGTANHGVLLLVEAYTSLGYTAMISSEHTSATLRPTLEIGYLGP